MEYARQLNATGIAHLTAWLHSVLRDDMRGGDPADTLSRYVRWCGERSDPIAHLEVTGHATVPRDETCTGRTECLYADIDWFVDTTTGCDAPGELD